MNREITTGTTSNICPRCGRYIIDPLSYTGTGQIELCECNKVCMCEERCQKCGGIILNNKYYRPIIIYWTN
jgi:hypothetical protein